MLLLFYLRDKLLQLRTDLERRLAIRLLRS